MNTRGVLTPRSFVVTHPGLNICGWWVVVKTIQFTHL